MKMDQFALAVMRIARTLLPVLMVWMLIYMVLFWWINRLSCFCFS